MLLDLRSLWESADAGDITGTGAITAPPASLSGSGSVGGQLPAGGWVVRTPSRQLRRRGAAEPQIAIVGTGAVRAPAAALRGSGRVANPVTGEGHVLAPAAALAGQGQITLAGLTSVLVPAHLVGPGAADDDVEEWHHRHSLIEAEEADLLSELLR